MDRWLKTGRLETTDDDTESCIELPFHQTKNKESDEHGEKKGKKRKYDSDYLELGFYETIYNILLWKS